MNRFALIPFDTSTINKTKNKNKIDAMNKIRLRFLNEFNKIIEYRRRWVTTRYDM